LPRSCALLGLLGLISLSAPGCIVLKSQHMELVEEVDELKKQQASRDKELAETLKRADEQMGKVEGQLDKAAEILGQNQATLGVRVEDLELGQGEVRGIAEDGVNQMAALSQNIEEIRAELQERLNKLEAASNANAEIPEGKQALLKGAERAHKSEKFKDARKLFRIYLSRYPGDAKEAEVRFKIGLTLYSENDDRSALGEFHWIVTNKPDSAIIPDALYYSGLAWYRLHNCPNALAYFDAVLADPKASDRYKKAAKKQRDTINGDTQGVCKSGTSESKRPQVEGGSRRPKR
jgi:TolA-binding protein